MSPASPLPPDVKVSSYDVIMISCVRRNDNCRMKVNFKLHFLAFLDKEGHGGAVRG